jgi:putative serine/threonine protein kinase
VRFEEFKSQVEGLELFSKGWRGFIFRGLWKSRKVALKVAKDKDREYAIRKECEILEFLKGVEGFPQLLLCGEDFFIYEFIEGTPVERAKLSREDRLKVYINLLDLIKKLDELGINKDELSRLDKNTLIGEDLKVYMLDFERGQRGAKKRHNLSQFLQLLLREGYLDLEKARALGRVYTRGDDGVYHEVRSILEGALSASY